MVRSILLSLRECIYIRLSSPRQPLAPVRTAEHISNSALDRKTHCVRAREMVAGVDGLAGSIEKQAE